MPLAVCVRARSRSRRPLVAILRPFLSLPRKPLGDRQAAFESVLWGVPQHHRASPWGGIDIAFPARPQSSPSMRRALREFLAPLRLDPERLEDVVLAAGEAIANAIEHAYRGGRGTVRLRAFATPTHLIVEVSDRGSWRLGGEAERGHGLGLMRALVDRVAVESTHEGTKIRLELAL